MYATRFPFDVGLALWPTFKRRVLQDAYHYGVDVDIVKQGGVLSKYGYLAIEGDEYDVKRYWNYLVGWIKYVNESDRDG